jgi:hypothetical protein
MVPSSRVGLWGEVGTDLAAPAPNLNLELGPMPIGLPGNPIGHRESCMRCATQAPR